MGNELHNIEWPWITDPAIDFLIDYLKPEHKILEFGSGGSTLWFGKYTSNVITIESSGHYYREIKDKCKTDLRLMSEPYYSVCDTFPDNHFDAIVSNRFLHLVYEDDLQKEVTKEMHRVLKDGGLLILSTRSTEDPDCIPKNKINETLHEIKDRPGHKIRFNTKDELKKIFNHFSEITHETLEEAEAFDRQFKCHLLKIIAKK